ncbi:MAG: hypothetical protein ACYC56_05375 [Candidatus Aquicultor sp.]
MASNPDQIIIMFFGAPLALIPAIIIVKLTQKTSAKKLYYATNIAFVVVSIGLGLNLLSRLASGQINMQRVTSWKIWLVIILGAVISLIALVDAINGIKEYRRGRS